MNLLILATLFSMVLAEKSPRLKFTVMESPRFRFMKPENYTTVYHLQETDVLYVGGQGVIYKLTFSDKGVHDTQIHVVMDENAKETCVSKSRAWKQECANFITVIERVGDSFVVCGTRAGAPKCWLLVNDSVLTDMPEETAASNILAPFPFQRSISLSADGKLYSALSAVAGHTGSIRRTYGSKKQLKTENKWLQNPQFAGAAVIPHTEKLKDEIYFFFSEVNSTASLDEEPYRARIGRVCMVDEGGLQNVLPNSWTTFLKARVMCGKAGTPVQYNNFKQAFVLSSHQRTGLIYGIFSNVWNTTVVCAYSIEDTDQAFSTSKLKGYNSPLSTPRPGTCAFRNNTQAHTQKILTVIKDHPEIEDMIIPVDEAPLDLPVQDHFTHIVADTVLAVNEEHYSIIYLGTEKGKVLKVLHTIEGAFIIAQYSLFHDDSPVINMAIDSKKGHLYIGTELEVQRIPLADCGRYGASCQECILSRDPYCAWDVSKKKCTAIPPDYNISTGTLVQTLDHSNASVCGYATAPKARSTIPKQVLVDKDGPVLLPCPVRSYHATYRWEKDNCIKQYPCTISGSSCVLAPTPDLPLKEGVFRCMVEESGLQQEVVSYKLVFNSGPLSTSLASTLGSTLLLAATAHWLL
ncbi:semaphorin-7A-like [Sinocyclocheilus anshuiensis]|uniref:semaphorin-7A-like n=1 Tax=Sinocyclocheilus anshuiensis TaxID=1608454 RepID=UPI0007B9DF56|nr:PREDICTED: semaphorin-7A-like [Sinocyclocheilus anshuiensis]